MPAATRPVYQLAYARAAVRLIPSAICQPTLALRTIALFALARAPKINPQGIPADRSDHGLVRIGGEPAQQRVGRIKRLSASNGSGKYHDVVHGVANVVFDVVRFAEFREQRQSDVCRLSAERNAFADRRAKEGKALLQTLLQFLVEGPDDAGERGSVPIVQKGRHRTAAMLDKLGIPEQSGHLGGQEAGLGHLVGAADDDGSRALPNAEFRLQIGCSGFGLSDVVVPLLLDERKSRFEYLLRVSIVLSQDESAPGDIDTKPTQRVPSREERMVLFTGRIGNGREHVALSEMQCEPLRYIYGAALEGK